MNVFSISCGKVFRTGLLSQDDKSNCGSISLSWSCVASDPLWILLLLVKLYGKLLLSSELTSHETNFQIKIPNLCSTHIRKNLGVSP